jgi:hypothetical protein
MCSFSFPATVTVVNEFSFKYRRNIVEYQVVNYPVAEIGGKNPAFNRFVYNKTDAGTGLINTFDDF